MRKKQKYVVGESIYIFKCKTCLYANLVVIQYIESVSSIYGYFTMKNEFLFLLMQQLMNKRAALYWHCFVAHALL